MTSLELFAALDWGWVVLVLNEWVHAPVLWNLQGGIKVKVWDWVHWDLAIFFNAIAVSDTDRYIYIYFYFGKDWKYSKVFCSQSAALFCSPFFTYSSGFRFLKKSLKIDNLTQSFAILYVSLLTPHSRPGCLNVWPLNSKERCVCPKF